MNGEPKFKVNDKVKVDGEIGTIKKVHNCKGWNNAGWGYIYTVEFNESGEKIFTEDKLLKLCPEENKIEVGDIILYTGLNLLDHDIPCFVYYIESYGMVHMIGEDGKCYTTDSNNCEKIGHVDVFKGIPKYKIGQVVQAGNSFGIIEKIDDTGDEVSYFVNIYPENSTDIACCCNWFKECLIDPIDKDKYFL